MNDQSIGERLTHALFRSRSYEEAEQLFAALVLADRSLAVGIRDMLERVIPNAAPLWQAILDHAEDKHQIQDTQLEDTIINGIGRGYAYGYQARAKARGRNHVLRR